MIIPHTSSRSGRRLHRGFTLMEICVVVAILATLATMGWQATKMVRTREMNKTAELQISQMEAGMNAYRQDVGDNLPAGDGDEWSSHVLYSVLYCDEDDDGQPDVDPKSGETRIPYCEALTPMAYVKNAKEILNGIPVVKKSIKVAGSKNKKRKCFVILDPWNASYRYRLGYDMREPSKNSPGKGINPDFDIFSLGADSQGNGLNNLNDNEDNISNIRSWN